LTLIELMVVVTIMALLMVLAIPTLAPAIRGQQVRDGARQLSAFIQGARARAIERGHPVGVILERFGAHAAGSGDPSTTQFCVDVRLCEIPEPYSGDLGGTRLLVRRRNVNNLDAGVEIIGFNDGSRPGDGIIRLGDQIRFNHQGPLFRLDGTVAASTHDGLALPQPNAPWTIVRNQQAWLPLTESELIPYLPRDPDPSDNMPPRSMELEFQIFRQPLASASTVLQMPGNAVVDLELSGLPSGDYADTNSAATPYGSSFSATRPAGHAENPTGAEWTEDDMHAPIIMMFAPDGSLERIAYGHGRTFRPIEQIYLLVGKREKVRGSQDSLVDPTQKFNFQDPDNRWIAIEPSSGRTVTAEVSAGTGITLQESRQFAEQASAIGGRR
jgi:type II secretory pathway pseudopilin PulG